MGKLLTIVVAVFGLVATVWNTLSVEKKSEVLEETDAVVSGMKQELETGEMNYRLAVQEFNFSTLHAATAYEIDRNDKLLGASVAPGATILRQKGGQAAPGAPARRSVRERSASRRKQRSEKRKQTPKRALKPGVKPAAPPKGTSVSGKMKTLRARPSLFSRLQAPKAAPRPPTAGSGSGQAPKTPKWKLGKNLDAALSRVKQPKGPRRPSQMTEDRRRQLFTVRGFQIENLSRWRQYMHVALSGERMTEEQADAWEGLLAEALLQGKDAAIKRHADDCAKAIEDWEQSYEEGRTELEEESDAKAVLEKQVDRGKSIYMGLMLVGLVLVTLKDVFGKDKD